MLTTAWLTTNRQCNMRCPWCYARATEYTPHSQMTPALAERVTQIVKEMGIRYLILFGGEPTIWSGLDKTVRDCRAKGIHTTMVTNGLRFAEDAFWGRYLENPCDSVGVSVKAGNPEQFIALTAVDSFSSIEKALRRVANSGLSYGVSVTYNANYRGNMDQIIQFIMDCGIKSVKIDFCTLSFMNGKPDDAGTLAIQELVSDTLSWYPRAEQITGGNIMIELNTPLCIWPEKFIGELREKGRLATVCQLLKRRGIIFDTDGNLLVCNGLFDYPIARFDQDFRDAESLSSFLRCAETQAIYDRFRSYPAERCITCAQYDECGGGCPLRWTLQDPKSVIQC